MIPFPRATMHPPATSPLEQSIEKLEASQARLRALLAAAGTIYFLVLYWQERVPLAAGLFAGGYTLAALLWAAWIRLRPAAAPWRRWIPVVTDAAALSLASFIGGPWGVVFYPMFLQVILGHGMRFGIAYLIAATVTCTVGFGTVLVVSPYWRAQPGLGLALLAGLVILPLYVGALLRHLLRTNDRLHAALLQASHAAAHDPLTGLVNRAQFYTLLEEALADRRRERFAIAFIDLDGFKQVNDTFGHHRGDELLKRVAEVLREHTREHDAVARLGGDEFGVLIREVDDVARVERMMRRVVAEIEAAADALLGRHMVSASIGIALNAGTRRSAEEMLHAADAAMYRAKATAAAGVTTEEPRPAAKVVHLGSDPTVPR